MPTPPIQHLKWGSPKAIQETPIPHLKWGSPKAIQETPIRKQEGIPDPGGSDRTSCWTV